MARIGSEAFAVFNGFEVIHFAGICASLGIDAGPHGDLCIDAAVVAMGFDGLRDQQNSDAKPAEAADGRIVQLPIKVLHPFISKQGIQGDFLVTTDDENRFVKIAPIKNDESRGGLLDAMG